MKKKLWRNKQSDRPISDSEIKAVLSQLFKTGQCLTPAGHVSEDVTSHAQGPFSALRRQMTITVFLQAFVDMGSILVPPVGLGDVT
ncbi:hypothetical protein AVEN_264237-1, partial [Araneus ventricosus]